MSASLPPLRPDSSSHRRFYDIAGVTVEVAADVPLTDHTFASKFKSFRVNVPGPHTITVRHHFGMPKWYARLAGRAVLHEPPWTIYRDGTAWIYVLVPTGQKIPVQIARFDDHYSCVEIFSITLREKMIRGGNLSALTALPSDQIFLVPVLAQRQGCFIHSAGVILNGKGLIFAGQSGAGKSTMVKMLGSTAEILCDDRVIVRRHPEGFRVYGTWDHGEVPLVSPSSAPLRAILFLHKADENRLVPLQAPGAILGQLLVRLVRPPLVKEWWDHIFPLVESMVRDVPCYDLQFDKTGEVVKLLEESFP